MRPGRLFWDTDIGGNEWRFPETAWSRILLAREGSQVQASLESLANTYWKPVYCFIRARHAASNEEAKDRTQDFFVWMMEKEFLARADPQRGRFRAFLKTSLEHYLSNQDRTNRAQRRGGDLRLLKIDDLQRDQGDLPDPATSNPNQALDEAWRRDLLERSLLKLEKTLAGDGKAEWFELFSDYFLDESESDVDYAELGRRYKLSLTDVSNRLMLAKRKFRDVLLEEVAETVEGMDDLRAELNWLFRKDGP